MRAIRIVLLIANGVWLPIWVVGHAESVYYLATYPTTHDQIFASVLLAVTIPTVVGSFTLAGNIAYIWRLRPRAIRIALLIANGGWLPVWVVGSATHLYLLATKGGLDWPSLLFGMAIPIVVCSFILAGNIAYIWRSRPHAHIEKGAVASHAPASRG